MSSLTDALEQGRKAHEQSVENAYVRSRRAITDPVADQEAALKLQSEQATVANQPTAIANANTAAADQHTAAAGDNDFNATNRVFQRAGQYLGAVANQLDKNPQAKPSDIIKTTPPEVLKAIHLDTPEAQQHFAEVYDANPSLVRAHAQAYGASGAKVKSSEFAKDKDGTEGTLVTMEDGTQSFHPGYSGNKEFAPQREKTPEELAALVALANQRNASADKSRSASGTGPGQSAAVDTVIGALNDFKTEVGALDKGGGSVKTGGGLVANAINAAAGTGAGKVAGAVLGDKNAAIRQRIDTIAPTILQNYAKALGLKSSQLNTEKEYQRFAAVLGDHTADPTVRMQAANDLIAHIKAATAGTAPAGGTPDQSVFDAKTQALLDKYK